MRHLLNTLYVLTPNAYLQKDGESLAVKIEDEIALRVPIHNLESVVCFTFMGASPGAMALCIDHGVKLSFLSPSGRFIGSLEGAIKGNVLLRRAQYRMSEDELLSTHLGSLFIGGKIANHRSILRRFLRDHHPDETITAEIENVICLLKRELGMLPHQHTRLEIMGVEGYSANIYFGVFKHFQNFNLRNVVSALPKMKLMPYFLSSIHYLHMM